MADAAAMLGQALHNSMATDNATRQAAEETLLQMSKQNLALYLQLLVAELSNTYSNLGVRRAAGLAAKNAVAPKDPEEFQDAVQKWGSFPAELRSSIKQQALQNLAAPEHQVGSVAAQLIAAIASIELPRGLWDELIPLLVDAVSNPSSPVSTKKAALETIKVVCEDMTVGELKPYASSILTALVAGARSEEPSAEVRRVAMGALSGAIGLFDDNFRTERERNYIMQVVYQATQCPDSTVKVKAYECLVKIMSNYYDFIAPYVDGNLIALTVEAMRSADQDVAKQGVEFWSSVCEVESQIHMENADAAELNQPAPRANFDFATTSMPTIVPVLTTLLTQQKEDEDDDEWNIAMAASTCLSLLTSCVGDRIMEYTLPFIDMYRESPDWRYREAALMAFSCILEGPDDGKVVALVNTLLPSLVQRMDDPSVAVQDTAAWTVGKVCELYSEERYQIITPQVLSILVPTLNRNLGKPPRVAVNCAYALMSLVEQLGEEYNELATFPLSPYFNDIMQALVAAAQRPDGHDHNLRTTVYDAITQYVINTAVDTYESLQQLTTVMLGALEATLDQAGNIIGTDARMEHNELQGNLCMVLQALTRRLKAYVLPVADRMMTAYLRMFTQSAQGHHVSIQEDALTAAGALVSAIKDNFLRYMEALAPYLVQALGSYAEIQLCQVAIGLVGDLCRNLGVAVSPWCAQFMNVLVQDLQAKTLHRSIKPCILQAFGDVALALGPVFIPEYYPFCMEVLRQAAVVGWDAHDYEHYDYIVLMRISILEAYSGISQGVHQYPVLLPHLEFIFHFMQDVNLMPREDALLQALVGLLGDLCDVCGPQLAPHLVANQSWIVSLLKAGRASRNSTTKTTTKWANEHYKRCIQH